MVRRIFPFRDKCTPGSGKPCFNRQLGLCPGACSGEVERGEYAHTIRNIKELFSGKFRGLKQRLAREMKVAAKEERFEEAEKLRRQISALEHIRDVSLIKDERRIAIGGPSTSLGTIRQGRIEAFDVAHTAGAETVAVMTVLEHGTPAKDAYRKFKIHGARNDDVAAIKEALSRRLNHPEWPLPRLFVVDGGKAQIRAAEGILKNAGLLIPVVGVVKDEFHRPKDLVGDKRIIEVHERDILLANNEAHRFGIQWHRKRLRLRR